MILSIDFLELLQEKRILPWIMGNVTKTQNADSRCRHIKSYPDFWPYRRLEDFSARSSVLNCRVSALWRYISLALLPSRQWAWQQGFCRYYGRVWRHLRYWRRLSSERGWLEENVWVRQKNLYCNRKQHEPSSDKGTVSASSKTQ